MRQITSSTLQFELPKLYGITHDPGTHEAISRLPKLIKVSIGFKKGKAVHAYMVHDPKSGKNYWRLTVGFGGGDSEKSFAFDTRAECEKAYFAALKEAKACPHPRKLDYFTFLRAADDGSGDLIHDFDAIEKHGPKPTQVEVLFTSNDPFRAEYQMWSASELQCKGDGLEAMRSISLAVTPEEKEAAALAKSTGQKYFKVLDACYCGGCRFSVPTINGDSEKPAPCKPSIDLKFQLPGRITIGAESYFHSTSIRTAALMFSALEQMKKFTGGRLAGLPGVLVMRAFTSKHNGKAAKQFSVHPEFRADDLEQIRTKFLNAANDFMELLTPRTVVRALAAPEEDEENGAFIQDEFYPEDEPGSAMAIKTTQSVEKLKETLKAEDPPKQQPEAKPNTKAASLREKLAARTTAAAVTVTPTQEEEDPPAVKPVATVVPVSDLPFD